MANIEPEINDFLTAVYGEEVRNSMVSLARKLNTELETGTATINQYTTSITQAIADANTAAGSANTAAGSVNTAKQAALDAATAANTAAGQANTAAGQAVAAATQANTAVGAANTAASQANTARDNANTARDAANAAATQANTARDNANEAASAANSAAAEARSQAQQAEAKRLAIEANEETRQNNEKARVDAETERRRAFADMSRQVLPPATTTTLGGVIVGDGISVDTDGKVSVDTSSLETAAHAEATYATKTELNGKSNTDHTHEAADITSGTFGVARGGTGQSSHTANAVLTGNGTNAVNNVSTANGAFYATTNGGAATFGTLPIAQGGTGVTSNPSMLTNLGSTSADNVLKASPRPGVTGTLPIANGGTGATTAAGAVTNIVDGQAIAPASVAATGEVTGKNGTTTHKLSDKAEDAKVDRLQASLAPIESTTATTSHPMGDTFMLDGSYRRATRAIAAGETINDTNSEVTTMNSKMSGIWDNCMALRGLTTDLSSSTDYNDYTKVGYYFVNNNLSTNSPDGVASYGMLVVFSTTIMVVQLFFSSSSGKVFHRRRGGSGWSTWAQL